MTMLKDFTIYIFAGSYKEAQDFARARLHRDQTWVFIEDGHKIISLKNFHYIRASGWQRRTDRDIIERLLVSTGAHEMFA